MRLAHSFGWILGLAFFTQTFANGQEWTRFRGPNGQGVSPGSHAGIPSRWAETEINWKLELEGKGHSSPVLWGERLFVTSADEKRAALTLYAIDARKGQVTWKRELELEPYPTHEYNTLASATPAVDSQRVYLTWQSQGHYRLTAFDHSGAKTWERDFGAFESQHGSGSSPIVEGDTVYLTKDPDRESFVVALNAADGSTRWQHALGGKRADYSTPCLLNTTRGGPTLLIFTSMEDGVLALDSQNGSVAWQLNKVFNQRCVSSPVLAAGLIVGSCGSGGGGNYITAVRPGAAGQKPEVAYSVRKSAPYVPTSVAVGNLLFLWSDGGIVSCLDAPTGKVHWQERVGGNYFASPISVDGRLFGISSTGQVVVLVAGTEFRELGRSELGEQCRATPAVSGDHVYFHTVRHVLSVGGR